MVNKKKKTPPHIVKGSIFLGLWAVLILIGIMEKRMFLHPDRMAFYHLPAAVCLVLASYHLSYRFRKRNREAMKRMEARLKSLTPLRKADT